MKIYINIKRFLATTLIALTVSLFLSYNLLFTYSNYKVFSVDSIEDAEATKNLSNRENLIEIQGTPNSIFKATTEDGYVYFSLKEYGSKFIIKDTIEAFEQAKSFKGNFDKLKFVPNSGNLIAELNSPIDLDEELGIDLQLTQEQEQVVSTLTASDFNEDTIIIFAKHTDRNSLMKVFLESVGIFLFLFFAIGVVLRILRFDHGYWDFDETGAKRKN